MNRTREENTLYMREYKRKNREKVNEYAKRWMWAKRHGMEKLSTGRGLERVKN